LISLRCATPRDAERLFAWRNDALTRQNSRNTDEVPWDTHVSWLLDSLAREDRLLLIGEYEGVAMGTVRFGRRGSHQEASWTAAPEMRCKGLAKQMVVTACRLIPANIVAEIRVDNAPSIKISEACGFTCVGSHDDFCTWHRASVY